MPRRRISSPLHLRLFSLLAGGALLSAGGCTNPYTKVVHTLSGDPAVSGYTYCPGVTVPTGPPVSDCGPEALTAVLNFYGDGVTIEEVTKAIFMPTLNGTLSLDMQLYARRRGFVADFAQGTLEQLKKDIVAKRPVIIMVDVHTLPPGLENIPRLRGMYHFFVITGFHDAEQTVLAEGPKGRRIALRYDYLQKAWAYAGNYVLVLRRRVVAETTGADAARRSYNAGAQAESVGKIDEALRHYTSAIAFDPNYAKAYLGLGNVYQTRGDPAHAEEAYRKAIAVDPSSWAAMNNLAWLWVTRREKVQEAESLARAAVNGYARELLTWRLVADSAPPAPDGDPAPGTLARLSATQQGYANALSTLAHLQRDSGRLDEAVRTWELALHEGIALPLPIQANFLYELGMAYARAGQSRQARLTLAEAYDLARTDEFRAKVQSALESLRAP